MDGSEAARIFGDVISPYVAALLFITNRGADRHKIMNNATASFVDTGKARLLITNAHVVHAFDQKSADDPSLLMVVGGGGTSGCLVIERTWLKDVYKKDDLKIDLATFELPESSKFRHSGRGFTGRTVGRRLGYRSGTLQSFVVSPENTGDKNPKLSR